MISSRAFARFTGALGYGYDTLGRLSQRTIGGPRAINPALSQRPGTPHNVSTAHPALSHL